jgi:3-oxoacyl-[acyl-carrier protein] reductase
MTRRLDDQVVVVTGAGSGIGRATALAVAAEGGTVVVADVNLDSASSVKNEVETAGGRALAVHLDVTKRPSWEVAVSEVVDRLGGINALVNNAGITRDRSLLRMTDDDWRTAIEVNLTGTWLGCQHVVPHLKAAGGGSIVNISSESRHGEFGQSNYAAAKAGVVGLTRTVALEHARHGVRCNAIAPGSIETPMVLAVPEEIRDGWLRDIPLGRIGMPAEVARAIVFLISEDSSYITGQVLAVDGGST